MDTQLSGRCVYRCNVYDFMDISGRNKAKLSNFTTFREENAVASVLGRDDQYEDGVLKG